MGDQSICDGSLSADDFYVAAKSLCELWQTANTTLPNWTWIPFKRIPTGISCNEGYLSLENVYHIKSSKELVSSQDPFQEEQPVDSATVVQVPSSVIHAYDFHIIYSFSYRNPVLYFHGHKYDGQPLDLDDIQKDLPEYSLKLIRESKWTFITFEEHPYLHQPWYMLHPCGTSDWMKLLQGNPSAANYLVSWLSVVGQAVGLRVPSSLTSSCFNDGSSSSIGQCVEIDPSL
ncbi:hypothetical protein KFK09_000147 [Dendrobium nobile]|uniref:Ubiquitin-like-conjugating enzyme ATG10 n=1 Tax=Dendrobium nobile TaxID=94219 RepID=A0A8T3CB23_DENNO|nr:hypothetical protein KFK09_000147 [Dendrobium nobile]